MAQAARLSQRMHKELNLLLTDPPPGASFPLLSDPSPSLFAIEAEIEGPQGTVYAGGKFRLKIQIPERYPFQPPTVTFATPIYHPNIDNGGRICLDILNLPPKGAWQPSLNISTVLTSIGLLLSEPNPDDGLMCEASKEYKYNRHAFDQKARSMTEKFARAGVNGDGSCSKNSQAQSSTSMVESKDSDFSKGGLEEGSVSDKKGYVNRLKLSLECSKQQQRKDFDDGVNGKPIDKIGRPKEVCGQIVEEYHQHYENLSWTKRKLSLGPLCPEQKLDDEKETFKKKQNSSLNSPKISPIEVVTHNSERLPHRDADKAVAQNPKLPPKDFADRTEDHFSVSKRKRFGLASKRLSWGPSGSSQAQQTDNKENTAAGQRLLLQLNDNRGNLVINSSKKMDGNADFRIQHEPPGKLRGGNCEKQQEKDGSILSESVIVLDSEDSEEESQGSLRSRLLLGRKRFPGKSKDSKPKVKS